MGDPHVHPARAGFALLLALLLNFSIGHAQVRAVKETPAGVSERMQYEIDVTRDPRLGYVPKARLLEAEAYRSARVRMMNLSGVNAAAAASTPLTWTERGPSADAVGASNGNTRAGNGVSAGRVRAIWQDISDATGHTVWVGGMDGGIWKTTDITANPANWTLVTDALANNAIAGICQDPTDPNIMYMGTGEKTVNADAVRGAGIWQSKDHGLTWTVMANTSAFYNISKILCDAAGNLYVGCNTFSNNSGLQRYAKATGTWTNITPTGFDPRVADMEMSSTGRLHVAFGYLGASAATAGYRYTDNPATVTASGWTAPVTSYDPVYINTELTVSGNVLYALPANTSYNVATIYRSVDGGANWSALPSTPAFQQGQAWYNLAAAVDPNNAVNLIVGGLDCYRTQTGGSSWVQASYWVGLTGPYVHADQQTMLWDKNNMVIVGNDGGIFVSLDGGASFSDRNRGLRLKQFYSVAIHPSSTNYFLAGAQDNGVHQLNGAGLTTSLEVTGGDGAFVHIDRNEPQFQFASYVYSNYRRSTDNGVTWTSVTSDYNGRFVNPTDYDDQQNIMYGSYGSNAFMRWVNAGSANTLASVPMSTLGSGTVSAVKVSPFTPNTVYFGGGASGVNPTLIKAVNAHATPTFTDILTTAVKMNSANLSSIQFGSNENTIIISFSNYGVNNVWYTTTGGASWTAIDGNLPDMPVRWAMFYPGDDTKAIIATETGVWQCANMGATSVIWDPEPGFPNVRTDMLDYRDADRTIVAATHGRGLFSATIPSAGAPLACGTPAGLAASSITTAGATLGWTAMSGATSYDVDYKASTSTIWINAATGTTALQVTLSGLVSSTLYDYRVRGNCSSGPGSYAAAQFTTLAIQQASACPGTYDASTNGSISGAVVIPFNTSIYGTMASSTDVDYYAFKIAKAGTATITLGTLPANYNLALYNAGGSRLAQSSNSGTRSETINYSFAVGTYYARVIPSNGAFNATTCYTLKVQLGTAMGLADGGQQAPPDPTIFSVRIYPNPTSDKVTLYMLGEDVERELRVHDLTGRLVHHQRIAGMFTQLDLSGLAKGLYVFTIQDAGGQVLSRNKVMKQ